MHMPYLVVVLCKLQVEVNSAVVLHSLWHVECADIATPNKMQVERPHGHLCWHSACRNGLLHLAPQARVVASRWLKVALNGEAMHAG